jgi:hypothetical protein
LPGDAETAAVRESLRPAAHRLRKSAEELTADLRKAADDPKGTPARLSREAADGLEAARRTLGELFAGDGAVVTPEAVRAIREAQVRLEIAAEVLDAEPPARAFSPLVWEPKSKRFLLFGGDHGDYLTNDLWAFDPAASRWERLATRTAPAPRAGHALAANGDGTITLSGGYVYRPSTDYLASQYQDATGEFVFDAVAGAWRGDLPADAGPRSYRTGPFLPDFFLEGGRPDAATFAARLEKLPANTWTKINPPRLPHLNRDWGSAILDPDHDLLLRWAGGHSAHGGTDVLHFHLATGRWELTAPVEFPLGQLYTNTEYPEGFNFNRRPWISGHTYQSYGYDPAAGRMFFLGKRSHEYAYDPARGDWAGRSPKPKGMDYDSSFYTLTVAPTPNGPVCWTASGGLFVRKDNAWEEIPVAGEKLPGSVVDNSTLAWDDARGRLLFFRKPYGDKARYDGRVTAFDWKTRTAHTLTPTGAAAAADVPYLCQIRADPESGLLLVGGTLPPGEDGIRRTPAYDCAKDRWVSLKLGGDDPSGPKGRNVSLGLVYDPKRKRFWAVDARSEAFVLRLDAATADVRPLGE